MKTKDRAKNAASQMTGRAKEAAGALTGNDELKYRGQVQQTSASLKKSAQQFREFLKV